MRPGALAFLLLGLAPLAPAAAQPAAAPAAEPTPDPARLAAAERLVALFMTPEMFQRILGLGGPVMDAVMDMTVDQLGTDLPGVSEADRGRTMGQILADRDPHYRERMTIRNRIAGEVMGEVLIAALPDLRRAMVQIYARRFNLEDLEGATAFYSTPSGRRFIETSMTIAQDPLFMRAMVALSPRFVQAMSRIEERVRAASAHLPPEPGPARAPGAAAEGD